MYYVLHEVALGGWGRAVLARKRKGGKYCLQYLWCLYWLRIGGGWRSPDGSLWQGGGGGKGLGRGLVGGLGEDG